MGEFIGLVSAVVEDKRKLTTSLKLIQIVSLYFTAVTGVAACVLWPSNTYIRFILSVAILVEYVCVRRILSRRAADITQDGEEGFEKSLEKAFELVSAAIRNYEKLEDVFYETFP